MKIWNRFWIQRWRSRKNELRFHPFSFLLKINIGMRASFKISNWSIVPATSSSWLTSYAKLSCKRTQIKTCTTFGRRSVSLSSVLINSIFWPDIKTCLIMTKTNMICSWPPAKSWPTSSTRSPCKVRVASVLVRWKL